MSVGKIDTNHGIVFSASLVLLVSAFVVNVLMGSVEISLGRLVEIVTSFSTDGTEGFIVWNIRMPRAVAAALGGAYLSVAGLLLQVYFRNPVVGPFILGISHGATLTVSVVMLTSYGLGLPRVSPFMSTIAAFIGAYGTMAVVIGIASRLRSGITLLITGLMIGYLCMAVTNVLIAFAEQEKIKGFVLWQLGSFAGFKWIEIEVLVYVGCSILTGVYLLSKPLNAFLLGEEYASTMGVNIRLFRILILLCACALAGMVTSVAGPVAFVGLAVPHLTRLCFGTSDNRILIPGAVLMGGAVTCLCDLIARLVFAPVELPISAITALFGAPIVISLLLKKGAYI